MAKYDSIIITRSQREKNEKAGTLPLPSAPEPEVAKTGQKRKTGDGGDEQLTQSEPTAKKSKGKAHAKKLGSANSVEAVDTVLTPPPPTLPTASVGAPPSVPAPSGVDVPVTASIAVPVGTQKTSAAIPPGVAATLPFVGPPINNNGSTTAADDPKTGVPAFLVQPQGSSVPDDCGDVTQTLLPTTTSTSIPTNTSMNDTFSELFGDDENATRERDSGVPASVEKNNENLPPRIPAGVYLQFPKQKPKVTLTPEQEAQRKATAAMKRANLVAFQNDMAECHRRNVATCQEFADKWDHPLEDIKMRVALSEESAGRGTKAPTPWNGYIIAAIEEIKRRNAEKLSDHHKAVAATPAGSTPPDEPELEPETSQYVATACRDDHWTAQQEGDADKLEAWTALAAAAREKKEGAITAVKAGKAAEHEMMGVFRDLDVKLDRCHHRLGYSSFLIIVPHSRTVGTAPMLHVDPTLTSFLPYTCRIPLIQFAQAMAKYASTQEESVAVAVRELDVGTRKLIVTEMGNLFKTAVGKPNAILAYASPWNGLFERWGLEWEGYPLDTWMQPGDMSQPEKNKVWQAIRTGVFKFVPCSTQRKKALYDKHQLLEDEGCNFTTHPGIHRSIPRSTNEASMANLKKVRGGGRSGVKKGNGRSGTSVGLVDRHSTENRVQDTQGTTALLSGTNTTLVTRNNSNLQINPLSNTTPLTIPNSVDTNVQAHTAAPFGTDQPLLAASTPPLNDSGSLGFTDLGGLEPGNLPWDLINNFGMDDTFGNQSFGGFNSPNNNFDSQSGYPSTSTASSNAFNFNGLGSAIIPDTTNFGGNL